MQHQKSGSFLAVVLSLLLIAMSVHATTLPVTISPENLVLRDAYGNIIATSLTVALINNTDGYVQLARALTESGTTYPTDPAVGYLYYRTDLQALYIWTGLSWVTCMTATLPPGTISYNDLSDKPDMSVFLLENGTNALTSNWNVGSYGIYGLTYITSTAVTTTLLNATTFYGYTYYWNNQNRTDVLAYPTAPYSYIIDKVSSTYRRKNGTTGNIDSQSTNASAVIDPCIVANTTILFREGTYNINYLLPVDVSNIHFTGSGWGTQFNIASGCGFNISSATNLYDIRFEDIYFYGTTSTSFAITSMMPTNIRDSNLLIRNCRFDNFLGPLGTTVNLQNLEESHIENNFFYQTTGTHLQFTSDDYDSGNVYITGNVFYISYNNTFENAICLTTLDNDGSNGMIGWYHIQNNHVWGNTAGYRTSNLFLNLTTVEGTIKGIDVSDNRVEYSRFMETKCANSTWNIKNLNIHDNRITETSNTVKFVSWDGNTQNSMFHNNYIQADGSSCTWFEDNCTSSTQWNMCMDNQFVSGNTQTFTPSQSTFVHGNFGVGASYTIKVMGADYLHNSAGTAVCNWGAAAGNLTSAVAYLVRNNDVYLNVTGGTVTAIQIIDPTNSTITTIGTSCTWLRIPIGFRFNVTYSASPIIALAWSP